MTHKVTKSQLREIGDFKVPDDISRKDLVVKVSGGDGLRAFAVYSSTKLTVDIEKDEG